jgi:hypothetical protein
LISSLYWPSERWSRVPLSNGRYMTASREGRSCRFLRTWKGSNL